MHVCNIYTVFTANNSKFLADFGIRNGSRLQSDDFLQDYTLLVNILHTYVTLALWIGLSEFKSERFSDDTSVCEPENDISFVSVFSEELERDVEFEVVGEAPDKAPPPKSDKEEVNSITNGNKDSTQPSTSSKGQQEEINVLFFFFISLV